MSAKRRAKSGDPAEGRDERRAGTLQELQSRIEEASDDPEDRRRRLKEMTLEMIEEIRALAAGESNTDER